MNTTLQTVTLESNNIGDAGATALAEALKVNTTLQTVNLQFNKIGDAGATALAEALKVNTALQTVNLEDNEIGDAGAVELAEALKVNTTVQTVHLGSNKIGDAGATALAEALKVNTTLQTVNLEDNRIGDAGAAAIFDALNKNTTCSVTLSRNVFGFAAIQGKRIRGMSKLSEFATMLGILDYSPIEIFLNSSDSGSFFDSTYASKFGFSNLAVTDYMFLLSDSKRPLDILKLDNNQIGDAEAVALAEAL